MGKDGNSKSLRRSLYFQDKSEWQISLIGIQSKILKKRDYCDTDPDINCN